MLKNDKLIRNLVIVIAILIILFLLGQMEYIYVPLSRVLTIIISPVIFASFFYYLFRPFVRMFDRKNVSRRISVVVVLVGFIAILGLISYFGGSMIVDEFSNFIETFSKQLETLHEKAEDIINSNNILGNYSIDDIFDMIIGALEDGFFKLGEFTSGWYSNIADFGTIFILIPILLFFMLKDDIFLYENVLKLLSKEQREKLEKVLSEIDEVLSIYFTSQLIVAFIYGIVTYIGYLIIGLPSALSLAIIAMFLSIIPFLGPILAAIPAFLIALTSGVPMVIKLIIVIAVSQLIDGNVARPNVMGTRLHIHPMIVIVAVILGISMFGFLGAFFAIPVYGVIRVIVKNILIDKGRILDKEEQVGQ
jgi:predicted PurR-regulated permease PerM